MLLRELAAGAWLRSCIGHNRLRAELALTGAGYPMFVFQPQGRYLHL